MKKRNSKKGFTLVELVIVIAVIAILAGVLIPTFGNVVKNAQNSADLQEARNLYSEALIEDYTLPASADVLVIIDAKPEDNSTTYTVVQFVNGQPKLATQQDGKNDYTYTVNSLEAYDAVVANKVYKAKANA